MTEPVKGPTESVVDADSPSGDGASGLAQAKSAPPAGASRNLRFVLAGDTLFGSLGLFTLFPVLGLLLADRTPSSGTTWVGIGLFCYTASAGLAALLINRWLPTLRYRSGMAGSTLLSAVAFGLLPYVDSGWALCALRILAGLGVSVHFVLQRVLVAEVVHDDIGRNSIYSLLQIAVNAAASVGPFVASFLYFEDSRLMLAFISTSYVVATVIIWFGGPTDRPPPTTSRWPISREVLSQSLRTPAMRRVLIITTVGAFVYAQFYSAFALFVGNAIDSAALRAVLLAGPAVAIVVIQVSVTGIVNRRLVVGTQPVTVLFGAAAVFGAAMLVLGLGLPVAVGAILAVLVFSVAEMMFTPMVSTTFAGLPLGSSLESFNLRQVCWTSGEAVGSLAGGSLFLSLYLGGNGHAYWLVLAVLTLVSTGLLTLSARRARV